jgi:hypothetical protein
MGMVRWDSGREGRAGKLCLGDEEGEEEDEAGLTAVSGSSWGGNVGDMVLFLLYSVTKFLLTTVNVLIKLNLTKDFVNRTGAHCCLTDGMFERTEDAANERTKKRCDTFERAVKREDN